MRFLTPRPARRARDGIRALSGLPLLLTLLAAAPPARAQLPADIDSSQVVRFGLSVGADFPVGDIADGWETGGHGGMVLLISPPGFPLAVRVCLDAHRFDQEFEGTAQDAAADTLEGRTMVLSGAANVSYTFLRHGSIRPYVTGGAGGYYVDTEINGADIAEPESKLRFGLNGGAGAGFDLGSLVGFIEGGLIYIFSDEAAAGPVPTPSSITVVPVSVGVIF